MNVSLSLSTYSPTAVMFWISPMAETGRSNKTAKKAERIVLKKTPMICLFREVR
jgi:hypothetical protein